MLNFLFRYFGIIMFLLKRVNLPWKGSIGRGNDTDNGMKACILWKKRRNSEQYFSLVLNNPATEAWVSSLVSVLSTFLSSSLFFFSLPHLFFMPLKQPPQSAPDLSFALSSFCFPQALPCSSLSHFLSHTVSHFAQLQFAPIFIEDLQFSASLRVPIYTLVIQNSFCFSEESMLPYLCLYYFFYL